MSKEAAFSVFCLENYKAYKSLTGKQTAELFRQYAGTSRSDCQSAGQTGKTDLCSFHSRHDQTGHCPGRGRP